MCRTFKYCALTANDFKAYVLAYFAEGRFALPRVGHTGVPPAHGGPLGAHHDPREIPALTRLNAGDAPVPATGLEPPPPGAGDAAAAGGIDLAAAVDWDTWFYAPGGVPVTLPFDDSERRQVDEHAQAWVADPAAAAAAGPAVTAAWRSPQWIAFAQALAAQSGALLARGATLHARVLLALDAQYGLSTMRNAEVRSQWAALALRSALPGAVEAAVAFVQEFGRMKYVRPLYCELMRSAQGRPAALALFPAHRAALHPICAKMVASDLDKEAAQPPRDPAALLTVPGEGGVAAAAAAAPAPAPAGGSGAPTVEAAAAAVAPSGVRAEEDAAGAPAAPAAEEPSPQEASPTASASAAAAVAAAAVVDEAEEAGGDDEDVDDDDGGDGEEDADEADEEEDEDPAPVKRVRFGQRAAAGASASREREQRMRVSFAAGTVASPPTSPAGGVPYPPTGALPPAPAPAAAAAPSPTALVATSGGATTPGGAALPDPKVTAARAELAAVQALRAAQPGLSAVAAARQVKGVAPPVRGGGSQGGDEDGEGGEADADSGGGRGGSGPLAWLSAATATALETPVVSVATAEWVSTAVAATAVAGAFVAAVWLATRGGGAGPKRR